MTARRALALAFAAACRPRRRLSVSQWADTHRRLSGKSSSEVGPWKTSRAPYLQEIMDALSVRSPANKIVLMKSAQVGGTEVGLNWIGYVIEHAPGPMLVVVPTLDVRKRWVRQRIDPMLTETPTLAAIFDARRRRDAANSEDIKDFPGGFLIIGGANSPASLSSMPIKYVLCDEVDRFPWEVGAEGDPLGLVRQRQMTFPRRKEFLISTPTVQGASRIEEEFKQSDQRYYNMPCPHCSELLVFRFKNLRWSMDPDTREPFDARYVCEHCGAEIAEHLKTQMLERGRWIPTNPGSPTRGYHLNGLYAPIGLGFRWIELVADWLNVQPDPSKLKRFVNTALGEVWEDRSHDVKPNTLMERAEPYRLREIPPGCLRITAGLDVQDDRIAVQLVGWGRQERCWILDYLEIPGNAGTLLGLAETGEGPLGEYLAQTFNNSYKKEMRIEAAGIDSGGHYTHEVYNFVRRSPLRRLMALKGSNVSGKPILASRAQAQDINWRGKVIKGGVKLWMVGTDTAKHVLFSRLTHDGTLDNASRLIHFPANLPAEYFDMLTAEAFDPEHNRWVKRRGRRNESLDTWVYAAAAAQHPEIRTHAMRASDWARLEKLLEPQDENKSDNQNETTEQDAAPATPEKLPARRRRDGFVKRWRT